MYADAGFVFSPYSPHPDFSFSPLPLLHQQQQQPGPAIYDHLGNMGQASLISEYDIGGEGDLFKAPVPIIEEEPMLNLDDQVAATISMNAMDEAVKIAGIENDDPLLSKVLYECEKELMEKSAIEETISQLMDAKIPMLQVEQAIVPGELLAMENGKPSSVAAAAECSLPKSVSSGCLNSADWMNGSLRPNFLDFQALDLETAFGLRRAYSEGDIQTMGSSTPRPGKSGNVQTCCERLVTMSNLKTEERKQKLCRYRRKKAKRNFDRKIKYACRKALADSQPRVRGRFAKMDDGGMLRPRN